MWKGFAFPVSAALLALAGCNKLDTSAKPEASCDLCHSEHLNKLAVHRLHLSTGAMATFPLTDTSAAARMKVLDGAGDSTYKFKPDTAFRFSNSATLDRAARYQQTRLLNAALNCVDCHSGLDPQFVRNADPAHRNGARNATFDEERLWAKHYNPNGKDTAHYAASVPGSMRFDGTTCSNIACHGAGRKELQDVTWKASASVNDTFSCMGCHNTTDHKVGVACDKCHYDVTLDNGKTIHNFRKHLNDTLNYGRY